jgi:hypothetical protein
VIIGVSGHKRAGKNAIASVMSEFGFGVTSPADPVRAVALWLDPMIPTYSYAHTGPVYYRLSKIVESLGWENAKDNSPEVRSLLQKLGNAGRHILGEDVWMRVVMRDIESAMDHELRHVTHWVIPSVRFRSEREAIHELNGETWRVTRPGFDGDGDDDETETELDSIPVEVEIANDGTLEDLRVKVRALLGARGLA